MLKRLPTGERAGAAVAALAVALLAFWVAGFFWAPSDAGGRSRLQSALFYFGVLPALAAAGLPRFRAVLARSRVALATLAFVGLLAAGLATSFGAQEQSAAQVFRHLLATAVLVLGVAAVTTPAARDLVERALLLAAASAAAASLVLLRAGRSLDGRAMAPAHEDHPNRWAAVLGVAAVVAVARVASRRGRAAFAYGALALVLPALLLTRSRAAVLALVAGGAVALVSGRDGRARRLGTALLLLSLGGVSLAAPEALRGLFARGDAGRAQIWGELLERSSSHRLLGVGLTASDDVFLPRSWEFPEGWNPNTAHGEFLGTLYFAGLAGLALLVLLLVLAGRAALARGGRSDMLVPGLLAHAVVWGLFDGRGGVTAPSDAVYLVLWLPVALSAAAEVHGPEALPDRETRPEPGPRSPDRLAQAVLLGTVVLLVGLRLLGLSSGTDEPWAFRQIETAWTIRSFAMPGAGLLHGAGPWLGSPAAGPRLPLSEAIGALGLLLSGGSLLGARAAMLATFVAGALSVALVARRLVGRRCAVLAAAAFLALPLGFPGSTALLPGTAALALAPASAALLLRGLARRSAVSLAGAALFAALVLLSRPSLLVPWIPLLAVALLGGRRRRRSVAALPFLALPLLLAAYGAVRARPADGGPDLSFLPGAVRLSADGRWPEPPLAAEAFAYRLERVADAVLADLAGPALLAAALVGALLAARPGRRRALLPAAGALLHLLLLAGKPPVFPDAELLADAPAIALLVAAVVSWLAEAAYGGPVLARAASALGLCGLLLTGLPARARVEPATNPLALAVAAASDGAPAGALALVVWRGPHGQGPHLVYVGGRGSWSVPPESLDGEAVGRLSRMGLRRLAVVSRAPAEGPFGPRWLAEAPIDGRGTKVRVYRVGPEGDGLDASHRAAARSFLARVARN